MKRSSIGVILMAFAVSACGQNMEQFKKTDMKMTDHYKNYEYLNNNRPGYYLQVNNQNCHYEITLNDFTAGRYFEPYPVYSVRVPLNLRILSSGEQKLSLKVLPFVGDTLSDKAGLQLRLIRYADMTDLENEFGGSTILWEWKMPKLGEQNLPVFVMDTVFEAEVPYKLEVLDLYATDLSQLEEREVFEEVLEEFKKKRKSIIEKTQDRDYLLRHLGRAFVQIYPDKELLHKTVDGMMTIEDGMQPQPLEDFEFRLYYNNRLATLVQKENKEPAIWFKNPETGDLSSQPYYIFKHKDTGTWHMW